MFVCKYVHLKSTIDEGLFGEKVQLNVEVSEGFNAKGMPGLRNVSVSSSPARLEARGQILTLEALFYHLR